MTAWDRSERARWEQMVRERFEDVIEEYLALVDTEKSGHVLVHFQHGLPGKTDWRIAGSIRRRQTGTDG